MSSPLRVCVIGAGVSGIAAAWLTQHDHRVTLIEGSLKLGGHAETLPVTVSGATVHAELGTRFFFPSAYPYFLALIRVLGVPLRWNDARVSVTNVGNPRKGHTVVLPPRSLGHVASIVSSPRLVRHLISLRRLIREQPVVARRRDFSVTLESHLEHGGYPWSFGPEFAYPFLAACWGAPLADLPIFPVYSLLKGMPPGDAPGFHEIEGGMSRYMRAFGAELTDVDVRLGVRVRRVTRDKEFRVEDDQGETHHFDRLVVATSARDAVELLRDVPDAAPMRDAVARFRHFETETVVHGDRSFMPADRKDWAHTNLFLERDVAWMTDWPGLADDVSVFRTWLPKGRAAPSPLYGRRSFHHLVMTPENALLQRRIATLQGTAGLWVTGMYVVDVDNHESALLSALAPGLALAPRSPNLARWLAAVADDRAHGLEVLPLPLPVADGLAEGALEGVA